MSIGKLGVRQFGLQLICCPAPISNVYYIEIECQPQPVLEDNFTCRNAITYRIVSKSRLLE